MIAAFGTPGSVHHTWKHFPATRHNSHAVRAQAREWLRQTRWRHNDLNPVAIGQPELIHSDREAAKMRWLDGTRIYEGPDPTLFEGDPAQ